LSTNNSNPISIDQVAAMGPAAVVVLVAELVVAVALEHLVVAHHMDVVRDPMVPLDRTETA